MKRLLYILLLMMPLMASAQNKSLEFYYIAHDRSTPVNELCDRLEQVYYTAMSYDDFAVIFYLPNYDEPVIVKMNLPGDNRDDFKKIISELRLKAAHEIYPDLDYKNITELINNHDFIDDEGNPRYTSVLFCWYVNPDFWLFKYNERLIASMYFNMELNKYKGYVTTQVLHASGDGLVVDEKYPFGSKNLCADMDFMLMEY